MELWRRKKQIPTRFLLRLGGFLCLLLILPACYNKFEKAPTQGAEYTIASNCSIKKLNEMLGDAPYLDVEDELTIEGIVSANDEGGNFYRSFFIEQEGYALEVLEGLYSSHVYHQIGTITYVKVEGLRLARRDGVLQVGMAGDPLSGFDLDYLEHKAIIDKHIINSAKTIGIEPLELNVADLINPSISSHSGRLVSINDIQLSNTVESSVWSGDHAFVAAKDISQTAILWVRSSEYSHFALSKIEKEECKIIGILSFGTVSGVGGRAIIEMRNLEDCIVE